MSTQTETSKTIRASEAKVGGVYRTARGRTVKVRSKQNGQMILWSKSTGHLVAVAPDYELVPVWETLFSSEGSTC